MNSTAHTFTETSKDGPVVIVDCEHFVAVEIADQLHVERAKRILGNLFVSQAI